MPKRPSEHGNDGLATDKLREFLPKIWIYKSVRDAFSGFEYGEDWLIEIVEQGKPTGIEFCVQNKVTSKIGKGTISAEIEVDTLRHLQDLGRPVLIHIYSTSTDKSYWMWFEDFYAKNQMKWHGKKKVSVPVPTRNVLDASSVKQIRDYAGKFHQRQSFFKRYEAISRTDPDYKLDLTVKDGKNWVVLYAKHDNPRPLTLSFSDIKAAEAFQKSLETGDSVRVPGSIQLDGILEAAQGDISVFPLTPDENFPLKIQLISQDEDLLSEIPFLDMKLAKAGMVSQTWQGKSRTLPIIVTIVSTHNKGIAVNYKVDLKIKNPVELQRRLILCDNLANATKYLLTNLETGMSLEFHQDQITNKEPIQIDESLKSLVWSLAKIAEKLHVVIEMPGEFLYEELRTAQDISRVLETGVYSEPNDGSIDHMFLDMPAIAVQELLDTIAPNTNGIVVKGTKHDSIELFGHQLDLGPAEAVFYGKNVDFDGLQKRLQNIDDLENTSMEIQFEVDKEYTFVKFLNWYREVPSATETNIRHEGC